MAHSYVEAFDDELEAFVTFANDFPERATFLVDTYDTMAGVTHAIAAIRALGLEDRAAVRLDSGDVVDLARQTRDRLDTAGLVTCGSSCPVGSMSTTSPVSSPRRPDRCCWDRDTARCLR